MKIVYGIIILIILILIAFFVFTPGIVYRSINKTIVPNNVIQPVSWYDSIPFIADLHCDALLWNRNLLHRSKDGHVDIPRMQQANAAFQVFTIVSKTPSGINIENNTDKRRQFRCNSTQTSKLTWRHTIQRKSFKIFSTRILHI